MHELSYNLSRGTASITIGKNVKDCIEELPEDSLIVYPESVKALIEPLLQSGAFNSHIIEDGEEGKSLHSVVRILEHMKSAGFKRTSSVVSFGGGSTSDTVGLAASMYMRGVNYISIPTTLLSMVDASLGGKNAVNLNGVKNLIGSFYSPSRVYIDTSLVQKMPSSLLTDGLGEIVKYALIQDEKLYNRLSLENKGTTFSDPVLFDSLVESCVKDKMSLVEEDEFDLLGKRIILNFGHTLGHAIESATDFSMGHGTAVANGILLELDMGTKLGLVDAKLMESAKEFLNRFDLPHTIDAGLIAELKPRMMEVISSDKKATKVTIKIPLPVKIGVPEVFEVKHEEVRNYLESFTE